MLVGEHPGPDGRTLAPRRWRRVLLVLSAASVVFSLGVRIAHRGPYVPGWDFLGPAHGLFLVETKSVAEILAFQQHLHFHPATPWNVHVLTAVLVPGLLASIWPWEYWGHVVTFAISLSIGGLLVRAVDLPWREGWIALLAWGASSTLLSQSITGLPSVTCFWPSAIALYVVLRLRHRPWTTLLVSAAAIELAWQGQEAGRTVFVVFLLAVVLIREAPWRTRALWLAAGVWQLRWVLLYPHANTSRWKLVLPALGELGTFLMAFGRQLLVKPGVDVPLFLVLGLACLLVVRRERWLWRSLLAFHLGLVVVLGLNGIAAIWPRRVLMLEFLCLAGILAVYREAGPRGKAAVAALLLAGNLWQIGDLLRWSAAPLDRTGKGWDHTLPYVHSTVDYMVPFFVLDWYRELRARADAGAKLLLLYNLDSYEENHTNPGGVLERLYLHLGHARFLQSVFAFGSTPCRWSCPPVRPLAGVDAFVAHVVHPSAYSGHEFTHASDRKVFRDEMARVKAALEKRFDLRQQGDLQTSRDGLGERLRFTLEPRAYPPSP